MFRPDFALFDPTSGELLAIIEHKDSSQSIDKSLQQVARYVQHIGTAGVRGYVATRSENGYVFFQTPDDQPAKEIDPSFLTLASLTSANRAAKDTALARDKKRTIDYFFVVCYLAALGAAALVVADYIGSNHDITILTAERLAVLAVIVGLLVLPFIQKFKALGVEIERRTSQSDG